MVPAGIAGNVIMLSPRELRDSWSGAAPVPFWLDHADRPVPRPALDAPISADLVVVGGGFSGLWTALLAKERDSGRQVLLIEADRVASAATGRNGGFCAASPRPPQQPRRELRWSTARTDIYACHRRCRPTDSVVHVFGDPCDLDGEPLAETAHAP